MSSILIDGEIYGHKTTKHHVEIDLKKENM